MSQSVPGGQSRNVVAVTVMSLAALYFGHTLIPGMSLQQSVAISTGEATVQLRNPVGLQTNYFHYTLKS
jgi:hypothetical protein